MRLINLLFIVKVAASLDSKEYYNAVQKRQHNGVSSLAEPERSESISEEPSPLPLTAMPALTRLKSDPDDQNDDAEAEEEQQTSQPDNQTLLRLLEENEKITYMFRYEK